MPVTLGSRRVVSARAGSKRSSAGEPGALALVEDPAFVVERERRADVHAEPGLDEPEGLPLVVEREGGQAAEGVVTKGETEAEVLARR